MIGNPRKEETENARNSYKNHKNPFPVMRS